MKSKVATTLADYLLYIMRKAPSEYAKNDYSLSAQELMILIIKNKGPDFKASIKK